MNPRKSSGNAGTERIDIDVLQPQQALPPQPDSQELPRPANDRRERHAGPRLDRRRRILGQRERAPQGQGRAPGDEDIERAPEERGAPRVPGRGNGGGGSCGDGGGGGGEGEGGGAGERELDGGLRKREREAKRDHGACFGFFTPSPSRIQGN